MKSPQGWEEPGQRPEFDEHTVVFKGELQIEFELIMKMPSVLLKCIQMASLHIGITNSLQVQQQLFRRLATGKN